MIHSNIKMTDADFHILLVYHCSSQGAFPSFFFLTSLLEYNCFTMVCYFIRFDSLFLYASMFVH